MRSSPILTATLLGLFMVACGDDERRPVNAACDRSDDCASGLCAVGTCLDPEGDNDLDGLINGLEAALGSNPLDADTDGDDIDDADELNNLANRDSDGDGIADIDAAIEVTHLIFE